MKLKDKIILIAMTIVIFTSCSENNQTKNDTKQNEISNGIDPKIGADKLLKLAQDYYDKKEYKKSKKVLTVIVMEYPDAVEANQALKMSSEINLIGQSSSIPSDVKFKILSEEPNEKFSKCNLKVQLNKKVDKIAIKAIAQELRKSRTNYDKLWIFYYIQNTSSNGMAWATSHYKPELQIEILGSTIDEDNNSNKIVVDDAVVKGKWYDESVIPGTTLIYYKKDGKPIMKLTFKNGSSMEQNLTVKNENGIVRLTEINNAHGEYYKIEQSGELGMYNKENKRFGLAKRK